MECKITYKGKEYRLPEFAQYLADEGIAEAIKNNVIKEAKFIKAYEKLFVAPKAVQPSEKKITQPQAEIQFKVNKIAEDDAENKHAEQQLQKEDNIEQEPNVQAIERQAESNDKAELEEVIKKVEEIINIATDVQVVDVASISTDEARFQNREELDEERVNKIAEGWNDAEQDPIHVWRDEKDGKLYVLSGHHRLQAAKKANRKTVKIIDRTNDFTEERAIKFATEEANTNRAMETPLERAKIYRSDIEKGMSSKELEDKAKRLEGKNSIYILALAYLNPKGKVMNMLNSLKENTDKENIRQAEKIAQWVGEARKRFDLTNEHENELYDALIDEMFSKRITNKVDFLQKVGSIVGEIEYDKNKPLNIRRFREVSAGQEEYDRLTSEIKSQIESKMSEVQDIRIRFTDPSASNYIPSTAKDYEQAKENADNKIASINAEIRALQSKLQELIRNKGKYLRAPQTGSLFEFQQIKKRLNTISPKLFNKLLQRLKKAFPKAKLNTFKESDLEAMLPEMSAEPVIGGIKYKKDATMPRATSIVKMKAVDLTNELDKNNFGKRLTRTLSKEASDKIDIAKENIQKAQKDNSIITSPIQVGYVLTEDGRVELQVLKGQEYLAAMQELGIEELAIEIPNSDLKTLQDRFETPVQKALKRHGFTAKQKDKSTEENVQFFRLKDGTIYGFKTPDGQVFINEDKMNANTPIHEYGHVWQSMFPTEFARGIELLKASKKGQKLIKEISQNLAYKDKTQQEIEAEALVTAIGDMGESYFEGNQLTRFIDWVKDLFRKIGQRFGVQITPDTTLDMFTRDVVRQMLGGKELLAEEDEDGFFEMMINGVPTKVKNMGVDVINGFYSPIEKRLAETKIEKQSANKWLTSGVIGKGDEAIWTGVKAWLESKNPQEQVSKSEIQQFLKDNRISVVEVVKGEEKQLVEGWNPTKLYYEGKQIDGFVTNEANYEIYKISNSEYIVFNQDTEQEQTRTSLQGAKDLVSDEVHGEQSKRLTKFSQYQLEGEKENYKEILVTLPPKKREGIKYEVRELNGGFSVWNNVSNQFEPLVGVVSKEEAQKRVNKANEIGQDSNYDRKDVFKSSHFDEPNILVHLRMNTRTDADGNKVLFLEEVQSDWGQKGKKEGFAIPKNKVDKDLERFIELQSKKTTTIDESEELDGLWDKMSSRYGIPNMEGIDSDPIAYYRSKVNEQKQGIPTAPFVTDTNAWTKLGLKVALKEAVKQGADKIAWTTGEQQNERYDLSKQVKQVEWNRYTERGAVKLVTLTPIKGNVIELPIDENGFVSKNAGTQFDGQRIDNVIGKEIGDKIVSENSGDLSGDGLKVGGKGMKGFYGSPTEGSLGIVGNVAKSLFKQEPKTTTLQGEKPITIDNTTVERGTKSYVLKNENGDSLATMSFETGDNYSKKDLHGELVYLAKIYAKKEVQETTQHSIDITPELKAEVEEGLPLFHRTTITKEDIKTIVKEQIDKQIESGVNKEEAISNILDEIRKKNIYIRLLNNNEINDLEFEKEIKEDYGISKVESGKQKAHRVIKRIITESEVVSNEQKEKLLEDEDSYYRVLTTDMIKALSKEIIDKLGIDEALRIVNDNDENYSLPIRGMLMGQLISHYQEQYNKIRGTSKVEEVSAAELEIGEKLHTLQQKLANEATLAGQFIYHIRTIYQMSGFAIETKVKRMIDESNKADGKDADKTIKELRELLMDKKAAIESALESFQKEQEGETKSLKEQIQLLEKEISELKLKADGRDVSKRTGAKGNPIKIKRYTDKDKAEEIKKKLFGKTRIGIGDLDELGYLSLYYIEELLSYGSAKIDGVIGKYDKRYYNKNKQEVIDAYVNARDVAIEQGVSEELLSTDEEITDYLGAQEQERVAKEIAKKQAQLLKLRNKLAAENNPDSARKQAPVEAAKMVVSDTKTILNLKDTKNEGTYLKKLVRLLHAKAKEKYKEKNKKEPKSILETIAFALENASSQRELWDGLINSIEQQIDNDENLSEAEKDSVKDFIETYVEQMIDTLVTESNQERLINEILKEKFGKEKKLPTPISREEARKTLSNKKAKLVDENGSPITTAQQINSANQIFKVITSIDWKDILRNENSINEINDKIDEVIDGTGITGAEVELFKQKLKDRFALRYQDVVEKKVAQFLNERNRGKLPKAFSGLSRNARKIAKLESAGILSDDRIKEVLQETLGIRSLTDGDVRYIRDLVNRIKTESKIMFYKEKLEEELQYFIKKKTDSTIWGFLNDQTAVGQFGSATNFVQNLSNVFEQIPVIVRTIAALKSPKLAMQILAEAYKESMQISKTIFVTGDVGRGVAFTDILGTREGQPRVRYLEYFKPTGIYGQMFGKKINLLPTTTTKNISKYVLRLFEAVDVYTSAVVAQMSTAIYLKKRLMAQGMTEAQATRKIRAMYLENNFAQDMRDSEKELKKQGLKQPTQAQIKRGAYELAERRRNEEDENKFAVRLGETLGQILTGKKTQTGLMNLPYIAADAVMRKFKGIKTEGAKEEVGSTSWRTIKAGGGYLIDRVAFPFFKAISNFTELAIEWTPYGIAKGAFYSASGIARAKYFKTTPYEIAENQHYAVNVTVKSIMGTVIYYAITNMLFGGGDDEEDKMKINAPSYGLDPYQKERVEDLVQAPKTLGVKDKTPIPLDMFGTLGGGMYMYEAANQAIQKAIDDAYSRIGGKDNIKKMNEEQKQEFENMKMEMVSKYLFTAMSGVTFDLRDSYFRRLTKPDMSIIGKPLGSLVVPLNAVQKEIGMYINPLTRESKGMANFVNNFSIMKAFDTSKPALDWRGREYKQYEVYPNNVIGLFNMMKENKYTDELDIAFADMGMSLKNNSQYTIDIERNKVTINGLPLTDRQFEMYDREYKIAIGKQLSNNKNQILYDYRNKKYDIVDKRLSIYKQLARATALANVKKAEIQLNK